MTYRQNFDHLGEPLPTSKPYKFMKLIKTFLVMLGIYTAFMFCLGYLYVSIPLQKERTCTPDLIDRIFK